MAEVAAAPANAAAGGKEAEGTGSTPDGASTVLRIEFSSKSLGISIDNSLRVIRVAKSSTGLGAFGVRVGHVLIGVDDTVTVGMDMAAAVKVLKAAARPVTLAFETGGEGPSASAAAPAPDGADAPPPAPPRATSEPTVAAGAPPVPERGSSASAGASKFGLGRLFSGARKSILKSIDQSARRVVATTTKRLSVVGLAATGASTPKTDVGYVACGPLVETFQQDLLGIRQRNAAVVQRGAAADEKLRAVCLSVKATARDYSDAEALLGEELPALQQAVDEVASEARRACKTLLLLEKAIGKLEIRKHRVDHNAWVQQQKQRLEWRRQEGEADVKLAAAARDKALRDRDTPKSSPGAVAGSLVQRARRVTLGALNPIASAVLGGAGGAGGTEQQAPASAPAAVPESAADAPPAAADGSASAVAAAAPATGPSTGGDSEDAGGAATRTSDEVGTAPESGGEAETGEEAPTATSDAGEPTTDGSSE